MKYCLIGKTLSHSYSERLHRAYGLDYTLEEVAPQDLARFVKGSPYDGFNVTIPYKKDIIPFLDELSPLAERLGAVNTVLRKGGRTIGYNTDYAGFLGALAYYGYDPTGVRAAVLGTGGAGQMATMALLDKGADVVGVSRKGAVNYNNCNRYDFDLIVNCTPVGTYPDPSPACVNVGEFPHLAFVYDLVYNPYRTRLMLDARRVGIEAHGGLTMLVIQALAAREIWTDVPYKAVDVKTCIRTLRNDTINMALMGMPSSGKTTVGRALAEAMGKQFVDVDALVTARTGRTPRDIILEDGEPAFRAVEAKAVAEVCGMRGVVIALGGGSVLLPQNRELLQKTAFITYITRDLTALTDLDRPTLQRAGAARLFAERDPIYRALADFSVDNDGSVEHAVDQIKNAYENLSD